MATIQKWTGREARALREAVRMSVRDFAASLGVSDRAISKWEAGSESIVPRPDSQAILDRALEKASQDARTRFELILNTGPDTKSQAQPSPDESSYPAREVNESIESGYPSRITHPADGKLMVLVDAGSFPSGPNNQSVWLPAFYIDVFPTTNREYSAFIRATGYKSPQHWLDGEFPRGLDSHPVVNVTYRDAQRYAAWARKLLPSAVEWEKAARGPGGNIFPWGNQETPAKCNVRQTRVGSTTPVDRYHSGVSHYDVYDLSGNVWEWCRTETDPDRFVLKGSAFTSPLSMASGAAMNDASASMFDDDTGFRCVSPLEEIRRLLGIRELATVHHRAGKRIVAEDSG